MIVDWGRRLIFYFWNRKLIHLFYQKNKITQINFTTTWTYIFLYANFGCFAFVDPLTIIFGISLSDLLYLVCLFVTEWGDRLLCFSDSLDMGIWKRVIDCFGLNFYEKKMFSTHIGKVIKITKITFKYFRKIIRIFFRFCLFSPFWLLLMFARNETHLFFNFEKRNSRINLNLFKVWKNDIEN